MYRSGNAQCAPWTQIGFRTVGIDGRATHAAVENPMSDLCHGKATVAIWTGYIAMVRRAKCRSAGSHRKTSAGSGVCHEPLFIKSFKGSEPERGRAGSRCDATLYVSQLQIAAVFERAARQPARQALAL
jgi:hypothetical protein